MNSINFSLSSKSKKSKNENKQSFIQYVDQLDAGDSDCDDVHFYETPNSKQAGETFHFCFAARLFSVAQ